jgi:chromosome segregation ATPase
MSNESKTLLTQIQELQGENAALSEQVKAFEATKAEHAKTVEALTVERDGAVKAKSEADATLKARSDELAKVQGELDSAKAQLENPAFKDAQRAGSKGAGSDGGVAGQGAAGAVDGLTKAEALAGYNALTDPKAKAEYRKVHAKALGL